MRILLAPLVLGLLLAGCVARDPVSPPPLPAPSPSVLNETWYLKDGEGTDHHLFTAMPNGSISSYPLFIWPEAEQWWPGAFTASEPSQGFDAGCVMLVAWIGENAPSEGTLYGELSADGEIVATGKAPYSWSGGPFPPFIDMLEVAVVLDQAKVIPEGSELSLRLGFDDPLSPRIGFGSGWPSRLEIQEGPCTV